MQVLSNDPRTVLNLSPMGRRQVLVIFLAICMNTMDGFDLLSISFAAPVIAAEWQVDRVALGVVLSMELIGMGFGALLLGAAADRFGRRPTVLFCLLLMTAGMLGATTAGNLAELSAWRILTGIGIGGMLPTINALTAEFANTRHRGLCISLMVIGYSLGGILGGTIASALLNQYGWPAVFYLGAGATAALLPLVYLLVPESVHWLVRKQPRDALRRTNLALRRLGHLAITALPEKEPLAGKLALAETFAPGMRYRTVMVTLTYMLHMLTLYFVLKWTPKIVVDLGFDPGSAGRVLVWSSIGAAIGGAAFGFLTLRIALKPLLLAAFLLSALFVALFGRSPADLWWLNLYAALAGFFTSAGVVGVYALMAQAYPTRIRAFSSGVTLSLGRGSAVLSPILTGVLFARELSLPVVAGLMACGALGSAIMLALFRLPEPE